MLTLASASPQRRAILEQLGVEFQVVVPDVADLSGVEAELTGFDACLFCLGVSAAGMSEERYAKLTPFSPPSAA